MKSNAKESWLMELLTPKSLGKCVLVYFSGVESLSKSFCFTLKVLANSLSFESGNLLGKAITVKIKDIESEGRYFNGIVCYFEKGGICNRDFQFYTLKIVPSIDAANSIKNTRIFKNKTILEIFNIVCKTNGLVNYKVEYLNEKYVAKEYCVQYQETDYNFLHRILEESGIYYYYKHTAKNHIIILLDAKSIVKKCKNNIVHGHIYSLNKYVYRWKHFEYFHVATLTVGGCGNSGSGEYTFPSISLGKESSGCFHCRNLEWYNHSYDFKTLADGRKILDIEKDKLLLEKQLIKSESNDLNLIPGIQFYFKHCDEKEGGYYRVVSVSHEVSDSSFMNEEYGIKESLQSYINEFMAMPSNLIYQPGLSIKKPKIIGVQTAIVIGPEKNTICADKYGRIKLKFNWDFCDKQNENISCWVRVSQLISGEQWGTRFIPSVGDEVIVAFINGNPEKPIVIASVYNSNNREPFLLPEKQNISGIKIGIEHPHELSFDDAPKQQKFFLHSGGEFNMEVMNDLLSVIDKGETIYIKGDCLIKVLGGEVKFQAKEIRFIVGKSSIILNNAGVLINPGRKLNLLAKGVGAMKQVVRVGDYHQCPKATGSVPHMGGPILEGSLVTKANKFSVACVGDKAYCCGPPDYIIAGATSITVDGKPIAKLDSKMKHGGKIIQGSTNVFVGELE